VAHWFDIEGLDVEQLLADWRWLCPDQMILVARSSFGDLFLRNSAGEVFLLEVAVGKFFRIADSESQFRELAETEQKREEWFTETDQRIAESRGIVPGPLQCIGFSTPIVFAESGYSGNAYVADLYEQVSFLGDLNRQISSLPEGTKVELRVKPEERPSHKN
jgi:hypothetical protein